MARKRIKVNVSEAMRLYKNGLSLVEIERELGVSRMTVLRRFREKGFEVRKWRLPGE